MARTGFISELDETGVIIEGEHFVSRVLSVNLQGKQRVFAYVATCGCEINAWAESLEDLLLQYEAEGHQRGRAGGGHRRTQADY